MSRDNQFHQYGYDHYLKAPKKPQQRSSYASGGGGLFSSLMNKVRSPFFAPVLLLSVALLFIAIIVITYPSDNASDQAVPVVKADLRPIKSLPEERGGMSIPHRDSTILARSGSAPIQGRKHQIEDLLAQADNAMPSKEDVLKQAIEKQQAKPQMPNLAQAGKPLIDASEDVIVFKPNFEVEKTATPAQPEQKQASATAQPVERTQKPGDILQKIGATQGQETASSDDALAHPRIAQVAQMAKPNAPKLHAAATAPDTLDFVRGVLNEKQGTKTAAKPQAPAQKPQAIEPAAGAASPAVNITAGSYYVQLASITDPARAQREWNGMQKRYAVLSGSQFRVQQAALDRGTFYRIQAGPMSKDSAKQICDALKQANKPGGCLVVK